MSGQLQISTCQECLVEAEVFYTQAGGWVCESCRDSNRAAINEEARAVDRIMTAREIFEMGFKLGQAKAGLTTDADAAFDAWLLKRASS